MSKKSNFHLPVKKNQARFQELVAETLDYARSLGASDAAAEVSETRGLSVSVRNQILKRLSKPEIARLM